MAPEFEKKAPEGGPVPTSPVRYDRLATVLHWTIALLVAANLLLALGFENLDGEARGRLIRIHKSLGVTILALALLRLLWRLARPAPALPAGFGPATRRWARTVHAVLLWLPLILALSGWAMISADEGAYRTLVFGWFEWPKIAPLTTAPAGVREGLHAILGAAHLSLALALVVLVAGHAGAALKHQFLDGAPLFERMGSPLRRPFRLAAPGSRAGRATPTSTKV